MRVIVAGRNPSLWDNRRRKVHDAPDLPLQTADVVGMSEGVEITRTRCGRRLRIGDAENWVETNAAVDCLSCLDPNR